MFDNWSDLCGGAHVHRGRAEPADVRDQVLLDVVREDDVVVVTRLDRLARSTRDLLDIAERPGVSLVAATGRGIGGDRLARLTAEVGAPFARRTPPHADDWNDELRQAQRQPRLGLTAG